MSQGHYWGGGAGQTQNQGNQLGDRPCVRQSALNRQHMGGNTMKSLLGQDNLAWNTTTQEGAYAGRRAYDHNQPNGGQQQQQKFQQPQAPPQQQQQFQQQQQWPQQQPLQERPQVHQQPQQQAPQFQAAAGFSKPQQQQQQPQPSPAGGAHRRGAGMANRQTYNALTGQ